MKTRLHFTLTFWLIILIQPLKAQSQSVELIIKEKGKNIKSVKISLCDSNGAMNIDPQKFRDSERIYFLVEPAVGYNKPFFSEDELEEEFPKIALRQSAEDKTFSPAIKPVVDGKKIIAAILHFPKSDLKTHQPFIFIKGEKHSENLRLGETYYDFYPTFKSALDEVKKLFIASDWLNTYRKAIEFVSQDDVKQQCSYISFSEKLTDELPYMAISNALEEMMNNFYQLREKLSQNLILKNLNELEAQAESVRRFFKLTENYATMGFRSSEQYKKLVERTEKEITETLQNSENVFNEHIFQLLKGKDYLDQRFATFIDIIYQSLLINIDGKDNPISSSLNASRREKLSNLGWLSDMENIAGAMEKRRTKYPKSTWLPEDVINNLCDLRGKQPKPYCEFLMIAGQSEIPFDQLETVLRLAINSSCDADELALLELWLAKSKADQERMRSMPLGTLRQGIQQYFALNLHSAGDFFDAALRQSPEQAIIWQWRAMVHFKAGENFACEAKVLKALELNHELISPLILNIKLLDQVNQNEQLTQIFSRPVANGPNYLFSSEKAKWLIKQQKAEEAIKIISNELNLLAPGQTENFFLLGDAYVALKQYNKAREAYMITQKINPFESERFEQKMRNLGNQ